jgi:hypothetical protein
VSSHRIQTTLRQWVGNSLRFEIEEFPLVSKIIEVLLHQHCSEEFEYESFVC